MVLSAYGQQASVGYINRTAGPSLPFTGRILGYSNPTATTGDVAITLGSLTSSSNGTVGPAPSIGQTASGQMGPMFDFTPQLRGFTNPTGSVGDLSITLGQLTLSSQATIPVQASLAVTLGQITLASDATIGSVTGNLSATLGQLSLSSSSILTPLPYTATTVKVRAFRRGWFDGRIIEPLTEFLITTPYVYSPYWMTLVDTPPSDWVPIMQSYSIRLDALRLRDLTSVETKEVVKQNPGPYRP
jgi:hypothetical protein